MSSLPRDLAEPLHLMNPYPYGKALALLAALALAALLWLWWRRRRRVRATPAPSPPAFSLPALPGLSGIEKVIRDIRNHYIHLSPRQGCHELSEALRSHYEGVSRKPISTLTAREIARVIGDSALASLFELLAELQFRRREPTRDEFREVCDLATETAAGRKKG